MKVSVNVPESQIAYALCSAFESRGGIDYWGEVLSTHHKLGTQPARPWGEDVGTPTYISAALTPGGYVRIGEHGANKPAVHRLSRAKIALALPLMLKDHPHQFCALMTGVGQDATTGDCLVQLALFGELRYG